MRVSFEIPFDEEQYSPIMVPGEAIYNHLLFIFL